MGTAPIARIDDPSLAGGAPGDLGELANSLAIPAPVAATHRRGLFMLIGVAGLLLAGGVVAVVLLVLGGNDTTELGLRRVETIDTSRPDDPTRTAAIPGAGSNVMPNPFLPPKTPAGTTRPKATTNTTTSTAKPPPELPGANRIGGDEVEAMARTQSAATQRCYMRAQRGADAIMIGDVKAISVTLDVQPSGAVGGVQLSQHASTNLGKCLISAVKAWKFRESPGGTYRIKLVFGSS